MREWLDHRKATAELSADGWRSPDTYCRDFKPIIRGPAVYLFLLMDTEEWRRSLIAYVGMSGNLQQRLTGHEILAELNKPGYWPMRWFKPVPKVKLRATESRYITKFDPPWNIQGRKRGVALP